jgi:hypothetical protein
MGAGVGCVKTLIQWCEEERRQLRSDDEGALGGSYDPSVMLDGYATERPSTFCHH